MVEAVDPVHGGLLGAPKFPQFSFFWLLWRGGIRYDNAAARAGRHHHARQHLPGRHLRSSGRRLCALLVDERWLVPHFEKMLYDNALLIELMTEVYRETRLAPLQDAHRRDGRMAEREMIAEGGGFAASLDADSEGVEGKFYVWTLPEILEVLGEEDATLLRRRLRRHRRMATGRSTTILNRLSSLATALGCGRAAPRRHAREAARGARRSACAPAGTTRCSPTGTG